MVVSALDPHYGGVEFLRGTVLLISLLLSASPLLAQGGKGVFRDSTDGRFDLSEWLLHRKGFLLVPIVITEPAVGYGGGLSVVFFSQSLAEGKERSGRLAPPTIFGGGGFYTSGGSYGAAAGFFHPFGRDRFRYAGGVGAASLDLKFYGFDPHGPLAQDPLEYTIEGLFVLQRLQGRIAGTDWFAGAEYVFLGTKTSFDGSVPEGIRTEELDVNVGGLGANLEYDTRDNLLDARRGLDLTASATWYGQTFGGDDEFGKLKVQGLLYGQPTARWGFGLRADTRYAWSEPPFFEKPYLSMRGLPALKYSNNLALLGEGELRFSLDPRWTLLGFGGLGWVADGWDDLGNSPTVEQEEQVSATLSPGSWACARGWTSPSDRTATSRSISRLAPRGDNVARGNQVHHYLYQSTLVPVSSLRHDTSEC